MHYIAFLLSKNGNDCHISYLQKQSWADTFNNQALNFGKEGAQRIIYGPRYNPH